MAASHAALHLRKQLKEITKSPNESFSVGLVDDSNIFDWDVVIMGPPDTPYEGGIFKARLTFPIDYPLHPPEMQFTSTIWHPNIYADGKVCISILHEPGDDQDHNEAASERWLPIHSVESIILSVISILAEPNDASPANLTAAQQLRENYPEFKKKVAKCVRKSQDDVC